MNWAYEKIREAIKPLLVRNGFTELEEKYHPQAFGSCSTTYANDKERIRLTWDGKEQGFVLESIPATSITFEAGWADILLQFYKPGKDGPEVVDEIAEDLRAALVTYLGEES
jgi:hypothetical protein